MSTSLEYNFQRYLAAKKEIDDQALNRHVWQSLVDALPCVSPLRVLEVGAGIGTMIERALEWGLLTGDAIFTAIDAEPGNPAEARRRLPKWAGRQGFEIGWAGHNPILRRAGQEVRVELEAIDALAFAKREGERRTWDVLIAHAFLDLIDIPTTLPLLLSLLGREGVFYFTINFDGLTIFEPTIDPVFDAEVEAVYHRTMDERLINGRPSGDSRSGRHLFTHLRSAGAYILDAGSSDWVVFPRADGYPGDEAYFLHFIVHTVYSALKDRPELDRGRLAEWVAQRHAQIERNELVYIAHQIDFVGGWGRGS